MKTLERERKNEDVQNDICESAQLRGSSNQTQGAIREMLFQSLRGGERRGAALAP